MKSTIEIQDELMVRAKRYAKRAGLPLRAVIEDGLRRILAETSPEVHYQQFDAFLECGVLAHGFLRLRCGDCAHEKRVAL